MLNRIIHFSLHQRLVVLVIAAVLMIFGTYTALLLPVDVLPDLNRPRVTIFLEAQGMAPEEIEALVTFPVETAMNGAAGVETVRSSSALGLGLVFVEFDWDVDLMLARQVVNEKLQSLGNQLPEDVIPVLGPITSVMGQIMVIGISADSTGPAELRTLADFTIRQRLLSIKGVSQVIPMGGDVLQYHVQVQMPRLNSSGLTIDDVENALRNANMNSTGNFFNRQGTEVLIRNIGRFRTIDDLKNVVVGFRNNTPVLLWQVADVATGAKQKRGDASVNGKPGVILTIEKQPSAGTLDLTEAVDKAMAELKPSLPADVEINTQIFRQSNFINAAIENVMHALRDGSVLVIIILFLFLLNVRTTFITLVAIPLSFVITALIFKLFGLSINTMTLGGIAIAIGELVDDAIVDVENVYRRLRENRASSNPKPVLEVVYSASSEVRNSIVYATVIVVLVFLPLFALTGMEGRIFAPLGIAYITSIVASLLVSLTVTPALCSYLLPGMKQMSHTRDSWLVRWLKKQDTKVLNWSLARPKWAIGFAAVLLIGALAMIPFFGTEFLPPFNEGSLTINFASPTGTSLEESHKVGQVAENILLEIPEVAQTGRRTGRAELDEHVEPVSNSEIEVSFKPDMERSRDEVIAEIRDRLSVIKGANINIGQPISHRLDHLLSGVRAQVAIKIFGNDLHELRRIAAQIREIISTVPGVVDIQMERQQQVEQLFIRVRPDAVAFYGMQQGEVIKDLQTLLQGEVVSQMLDGQKRYDIVLKMPDSERTNVESIGRSLMETPAGALIPVSEVAEIYFENGPNSISHENTQRRFVISCNVEGRDLGSAVTEMQEKVRQLGLPQGYYVTWGGQFESQKNASQLILWLSLLAFSGIFLALFIHFKSIPIVLQIMLNIPLALIGSIAAVMLTGGTFSIASLVGFITLTGIASRNGIMMISHYLHLMKYEGYSFSKEMIIRGSLERLVPVLMTSLVAALALIPLTLNPDAPGKEILYPVATVILGGLLSSTLLDIVVTPAVFWLFYRK